MKNCDIMLPYQSVPQRMSKARGLVYASLLPFLNIFAATKAMSLCVIKTAGRNDATVAKAIYTSLAGMGISYPQMACVMRSMLQSYMPEIHFSCTVSPTANAVLPCHA